MYVLMMQAADSALHDAGFTVKPKEEGMEA